MATNTPEIRLKYLLYHHPGYKKNSDLAIFEKIVENYCFQLNDQDMQAIKPKPKTIVEPRCTSSCNIFIT